MTGFWARWLGNALDIVFPPLCTLCHERLREFETVVCTSCRDTFEPVEQPVCEKCGQTLNRLTMRCSTCRFLKPSFSRATSCVRFQGNIRRLIHKFKYEGYTGIRMPLSMLLAEHCERLGLRVDAVIPVPLYRTRERMRGFNQAELLAERLSEALGIPLQRRCLVRVKATRTQTYLSPQQRWKNVHDAFRVDAPEVIGGKSLLLVDDVITTGATVNACAATLLEAGAAEVSAVSVARA